MTDAERKEVPIYDGVLRYFPDALVEVAKNSKKGNDQHNPGKRLFWDRSKSKDEAGSLTRHLMELAMAENAGDTEAMIDVSASIAWRALANLQKLLEDARGEGS